MNSIVIFVIFILTSLVKLNEDTLSNLRKDLKERLGIVYQFVENIIVSDRQQQEPYLHRCLHIS